jgi:hypothetical protein
MLKLVATFNAILRARMYSPHVPGSSEAAVPAPRDRARGTVTLPPGSGYLAAVVHPFFCGA